MTSLWEGSPPHSLCVGLLRAETLSSVLLSLAIMQFTYCGLAVLQIIFCAILQGFVYFLQHNAFCENVKRLCEKKVGSGLVIWIGTREVSHSRCTLAV